MQSLFFHIKYFFLFGLLISISCSRKISPDNSSQKKIPEDSISILDFGAIPNDNKDDSDAIQSAIRHAISNTKSSHVYCPPGIYNLDKGIVIGNQKKDGEFFFVTLTLSGHISAYTSNQAIGNTTVFRLKNPSFGIALQRVRNCVLENIVFEGCAKYTSDKQKILTWSEEDWGAKANARIDQYSPSCAIVIDPFHMNIPSSHRYKGAEKYYTNQSKGGSSMILIRGCSFSNHYIAIANNPSANVQNGDNIRIENSHVKLCHTFWSAGQTQCRANSISNVYALFLHTFISGIQIGSQRGTPPFVSHVNIAGFCKQLLSLKSGFSGFWIQQSYIESIWSLGYAFVNTIHFDQCQIKFSVEDKIFPSAHLYSNATCIFDSCSIEYFNNCNTPTPFVFRSAFVILNGGHIEGGVVVADGITNAGGEKLHNVEFNNVFIKCLGKHAGKTFVKKPLTNLVNEIILGGEKMASNDGSVFTNFNSTYNIEHLEKASLKKDEHLDFYLVSKFPEKYQLGDNLFSHTDLTLADLGIPNHKIRMSLGYVENIVGNKVYLSHVPNHDPESAYDIYLVDFPLFTPFVWGDIQKGSNVIRNVELIHQNYFPKLKMRINSNEFSSGTYIQKIDKDKKQITLNNPALQTKEKVLIHNIQYNQEVHLTNRSIEQIQGLIKGAQIIQPNEDNPILYCKKGGPKNKFELQVERTKH